MGVSRVGKKEILTSENARRFVNSAQGGGYVTSEEFLKQREEVQLRKMFVLKGREGGSALINEADALLKEYGLKIDVLVFSPDGYSDPSQNPFRRLDDSDDEIEFPSLYFEGLYKIAMEGSKPPLQNDTYTQAEERAVEDGLSLETAGRFRHIFTNMFFAANEPEPIIDGDALVDVDADITSLLEEAKDTVIRDELLARAISGCVQPGIMLNNAMDDEDRERYASALINACSDASTLKGTFVQLYDFSGELSPQGALVATIGATIDDAVLSRARGKEFSTYDSIRTPYVPYINSALFDEIRTANAITELGLDPIRFFGIFNLHVSGMLKRMYSDWVKSSGKVNLLGLKASLTGEELRQYDFMLPEFNTVPFETPARARDNDVDVDVALAEITTLISDLPLLGSGHIEGIVRALSTRVVQNATYFVPEVKTSNSAKPEAEPVIPDGEVEEG